MLELGSSTLASLSPWLLLAADEAPASAGLGMKLLFIVVLIVLGIVLGIGLSIALKMREYSGRLSGVLIAALIGLSPFVWRYLNPPPDVKSYSFLQAVVDSIPQGIDLAGGTNMVFQVYTDDPENKPITNEVMDQMIGAVIRRVNPSGAEEVAVRKVGADRIEVIIPGADRELVESKKALISRLGSLEFGILANQRDHRDIIEGAMRLPKDQDLYRVGTQIRAAWRDPGTTKNEAGEPEFKKIGEDDGVATREVTRNKKTYNQFLVLVDPIDRRITGENLSGVSATRDEYGAPAVSF
ncbi:MAG TPA: hypothetical protein VLA12_23385, partial [Planctomycetaceae bacterium]|nr:hypothetical protein [Planctomycetaceae bacterium]